MKNVIKLQLRFHQNFNRSLYFIELFSYFIVMICNLNHELEIWIPLFCFLLVCTHASLIFLLPLFTVLKERWLFIIVKEHYSRVNLVGNPINRWWVCCEYLKYIHLNFFIDLILFLLECTKLLYCHLQFTDSLR